MTDSERTVITVGHSPDADDAFMFYALAEEKISTGNYRFEHVMQDIETLNQRAERAELDLTALSVHAYAYVADRYAILTCGASVGDGYGPIVIAKQPMSVEQLAQSCIAVPGERTTAFLVLKLCLGDFEYVVRPFDQILETVSTGEADAGLVIHEGQLTYGDTGLEKVIDLGEWWAKETSGLPLPLGVNGIRRSLGKKRIREIHGYLKASIEYALSQRDKALAYALSFGRGLDTNRADRFVGMYVNDFTIDIGQRGRRGIETLLGRAEQAGLTPKGLKIEFMGET